MVEDIRPPQINAFPNYIVCQLFKGPLPLVEEDWVRDDLSKLDTHKSMGSKGMNP